MRQLGVRLVGGEELSRNLKSISSRAARSIVRDGLMEGAEVIRKRGARYAPRGNDPTAPDLADNIGKSAVKDGVAVGPTNGFQYGLPQEMGTVHHGAQPFMRPAFDEAHPEALQVIAQTMWTELAGRGIGRAMQTSDGPVTGGPDGALL